jgi:hypothetical protein
MVEEPIDDFFGRKETKTTRIIRVNSSDSEADSENNFFGQPGGLLRGEEVTVPVQATSSTPARSPPAATEPTASTTTTTPSTTTSST